MNGFYDCSNVKSLTDNVRKKNAFIKPYESAEDERLTWLKDVFLKYLESWKQSTLEREGEYTPDERQKMSLSVQTYEGLKIAVYSHIDAIRFLLSKGFKFVLSERFMQDVLDDYFGHQRDKGRRSDIAPAMRGNVCGQYGKIKWHRVSEEPVKKRQKK